MVTCRGCTAALSPSLHRAEECQAENNRCDGQTTLLPPSLSNRTCKDAVCPLSPAVYLELSWRNNAPTLTGSFEHMSSARLPKRWVFWHVSKADGVPERASELRFGRFFSWVPVGTLIRHIERQRCVLSVGNVAFMRHCRVYVEQLPARAQCLSQRAIATEQTRDPYRNEAARGHVFQEEVWSLRSSPITKTMRGSCSH